MCLKSFRCASFARQCSRFDIDVLKAFCIFVQCIDAVALTWGADSMSVNQKHDQVSRFFSVFSNTVGCQLQGYVDL